MRTFRELEEAVEETEMKIGKIHTIHCFINYLTSNGHTEAADLLFELKKRMLIESGEWRNE